MEKVPFNEAVVENNNAPRLTEEVQKEELQKHLQLTSIEDAMAKAEANIAEGNGGIDAELLNKLNSCAIDMDTEYPQNQFLFQIDGINVITQSDIHVVGGAQKSGKSTLIAIFMAAVLCGEWHRVKCLQNDMRVLYIDTEMKQFDTQNLAAKAAKMADVDCDKVKEHISLVNFRPLTPKEMEVGVRYYIRKYKPQLVIIDGIVDLCSNFNDVEASQNLVLNYLMKIAEQEECAIISVLHTNKTDNHTQLRGHLGSYFEQKGATVLKCERDINTNIVTVKTPTHRYAPVPEFHFTYDEHGTPICADQLHQLLEQQKIMSKLEKLEAERVAVYNERKRVVKNILEKHDQNATMKRKALIDEVKEQTGLGSSTVSALIKRMLEEEDAIIIEDNSEITLLF